MYNDFDYYIDFLKQNGKTSKTVIEIWILIDLIVTFVKQNSLTKYSEMKLSLFLGISVYQAEHFEVNTKDQWGLNMFAGLAIVWKSRVMKSVLKLVSSILQKLPKQRLQSCQIKIKLAFIKAWDCLFGNTQCL